MSRFKIQLSDKKKVQFQQCDLKCNYHYLQIKYHLNKSYRIKLQKLQKIQKQSFYLYIKSQTQSQFNNQNQVIYIILNFQNQNITQKWYNCLNFSQILINHRNHRYLFIPIHQNNYNITNSNNNNNINMNNNNINMIKNNININNNNKLISSLNIIKVNSIKVNSIKVNSSKVNDNNNNNNNNNNQTISNMTNTNNTFNKVYPIKSKASSVIDNNRPTNLINNYNKTFNINNPKIIQSNNILYNSNKTKNIQSNKKLLKAKDTISQASQTTILNNNLPINHNNINNNMNIYINTHKNNQYYVEQNAKNSNLINNRPSPLNRIRNKTMQNNYIDSKMYSSSIDHKNNKLINNNQRIYNTTYNHHNQYKYHNQYNDHNNDDSDNDKEQTSYLKDYIQHINNNKYIKEKSISNSKSSFRKASEDITLKNKNHYQYQQKKLQKFKSHTNLFNNDSLKPKQPKIFYSKRIQEQIKIKKQILIKSKSKNIDQFQQGLQEFEGNHSSYNNNLQLNDKAFNNNYKNINNLELKNDQQQYQIFINNKQKYSPFYQNDKHSNKNSDLSQNKIFINRLQQQSFINKLQNELKSKYQSKLNKFNSFQNKSSIKQIKKLSIQQTKQLQNKQENQLQTKSKQKQKRMLQQQQRQKFKSKQKNRNNLFDNRFQQKQNYKIQDQQFQQQIHQQPSYQQQSPTFPKKIKYQTNNNKLQNKYNMSQNINNKFQSNNNKFQNYNSRQIKLYPVQVKLSDSRRLNNKSIQKDNINNNNSINLMIKKNNQHIQQQLVRINTSGDSSSDKQHKFHQSNNSQDQQYQQFQQLLQQLKKGIILMKCSESSFWTRQKQVKLSQNENTLLIIDIKDKKIKKISISEILNIQYGKFGKGIMKHVQNIQQKKCILISIQQGKQIKKIQFISNNAQKLEIFINNFKYFVQTFNST